LETCFNNTEFLRAVDFSNSNFNDDVSFFDAKFAHSVQFRNVNFKRNTELNKVNFEEKVDFTGARFMGTVCFSDLIAKDVVLNWNQINKKLKNYNQKQYEKARDEFGILKTIFERQNKYDDMDNAYLMFKRSKRKSYHFSLKHPFGPLYKLLNYLILDLGSGYGTRPLNIFIMTFVIMLLFGGFYYRYNYQLIIGSETIRSLEINILNYMYFSFVTFLTMGAENFYPDHLGWLKYIAAFQAFLGFFLMTLFVATFTRKVIR